MDEAKKREIARNSWKRGNESVSKEDFKYAVESYRQAVNLCPDVSVYRQSLRAAEYKMYNDNKKGAGGLFTKGKFTKIRAQTAACRMRSQWDELDKAAEDGLFLNPWDPQFNADVGEACWQREFLEAASDSFKLAASLDQKNPAFLRSYAEIEEARGNYMLASRLFDKVYKLDPTDTDARRRSQDNVTKDSMEGKYDDEAQSTRDFGKPKSAYDEDRPVGRQPEVKEELTEQEQLERAIRKDETSVEARLKLAEFHRKAKDWKQAVAVYQTALDMSGGDANIREQLEDVELEILKQNLELARKRAKEQPDPKAKGIVDKLNREFVKREMAMYQSRIERYPNDSKYKYELGTRYMRFQKYNEAIPLLQQCVTDNRLKASVLLNLGKCFLGVENEGIAQRQFAKAVEVINPIDDPKDFCEAHYWLGRTSERKGDRAAAENHYNEILGVDYGYKDVQQRLDGLDDLDADDTNGAPGSSN